MSDKDLKLKAQGRNRYALVRGSLQFGVPVAIIAALGTAWVRWGPKFVFWDWGLIGSQVALNLLVVPVLAFFVGRALYDLKKR